MAQEEFSDGRRKSMPGATHQGDVGWDRVDSDTEVALREESIQGGLAEKVIVQLFAVLSLPFLVEVLVPLFLRLYLAGAFVMQQSTATSPSSKPTSRS